jgi:hypothetical protein
MMSHRLKGSPMRIEIDAVLRAFDPALGLIEDERPRETFGRVLDASRDSVRRAVHDLLRQAADEVNEAAGGAVHVSLLYEPDGLELKVDRHPPETGAHEETDFDFDLDEIDRLTLRLPAELKEIAAAAAEQAGISLNAWLTRLVRREAAVRTRTSRRETRSQRRGPGESLKGWIGER